MSARTGVVFSFLCGLHLAVLQFAYFFLMEAYLSSQALSYFVTLLFWLCGFLAGLYLASDRWFARLLLLGAVAYYVTWALTKAIPFHALLYVVAAACSIGSGLLAGYFLPWMAKRMQPVHRVFLHENNGFILGALISLKASIHCGIWFLALGPLVGAVLVAMVLVLGGVAQWRAVEGN
jgi:hypothetical protein